MRYDPYEWTLMGRRALCAALLLCSAALPGCQLLRIPLPRISTEVNVLEEEWLPALPRPIDDFPRLGVIGLELPLPEVCNLGDAELLARAYLQRYQEQELGELANNIAIRRGFIREVRLTASEGDFSFIADAGLRLKGTNGTATFWSEFPDRAGRSILVLRAEGDFNLFDLLPTEDECFSVDLLYSGTIPDKPVKFSLDLTIEVEAEFAF